MQPLFFGGSYCRKPLPDQAILVIPRVRCKACGVTHAVIPAFLFAYVRYPTTTLATYVEQAARHSQPPQTTWALGLADGPESVETLYRWLRRLKARLRALLPALQNELLKLEPAFDLPALQESVLRAQRSSSAPAKSSQSASSSSMSIAALCALSYWLSQYILQKAGEFLQAEATLSPVAFLNYFCWRKFGVALISPTQPRPP